LEMVFDRHYSASLGRFRVSVTTDPRPVKARDIPAEIEDLLLIPEEKLTAAQQDALLRQWASVAPELAVARSEITDARNRLPRFPTTLGMRQRPADNPRPTLRHHRREFLQRK